MKNRIVLTATTCMLLEQVRLAIEVILGKPTSFLRLQIEKNGKFFDSGEGLLNHGDRAGEFSFVEIGAGHINIRIDDIWYVAQFDSPREVRVTKISS